jgi:hypothetical protein
MIVGRPDTGKTTNLRTLASYASRGGYTPLYVDVGVTSPTISISGTIGAVAVTRPYDPATGAILLAPGGAADASPLERPLLYWIGTDQLNLEDSHSLEAPEVHHYFQLCEQLATIIEQKLAKDTDVRTSGMFLDVPSPLHPLALQKLIQIFQGKDYGY